VSRSIIAGTSTGTGTIKALIDTGTDTGTVCRERYLGLPVVKGNVMQLKKKILVPVRYGYN
jgi:hypothetical protein